MVECSPGERLALPPQLAHAPPAVARAAGELPPLELWCLDNSMGTFAAATPQVPVPARSYDLRSPLGVTPAALLAMGAAAEAWPAPPEPGPAQKQQGSERRQDVQQEQAQAEAQQAQQARQPGLRKQQGPGEMFRRFQSSRRELRTDRVARFAAPSGAPRRAGPRGPRLCSLTERAPAPAGCSAC